MPVPGLHQARALISPAATRSIQELGRPGRGSLGGSKSLAGLGSGRRPPGLIFLFHPAFSASLTSKGRGLLPLGTSA